MSILPIDILHFKDAATDMEVALWKGDLDPGFAKFLLDGKIEIASIAARPSAHLTTPDHQLEVDRVVAEFLEKNARSWIL